MHALRRCADRGHADRGWLESWHSFSFSDYHDPRWNGYSALRVINEDRIVPTAGFPPHPHRDMEIITYVLSGTLAHRDSSGGEGQLRHGELQLMSAGAGIRHSEINPSPREAVHLLQIWIEPEVRGATPRYHQAVLDAQALRRGFTAVVGPEGSGCAFQIRQQARLSIAWPAAGAQAIEPLDAQRRYYLHVARGAVSAAGHRLADGDALMLEQEQALSWQAERDSELLLFDLP